MENMAPEQPLPMSRGWSSVSLFAAALNPSSEAPTAELTAEEKEDLLKYFQVQSVRVLSDKGAQ